MGSLGWTAVLVGLWLKCRCTERIDEVGRLVVCRKRHIRVQ